jgi:hypothetical protein
MRTHMSDLILHVLPFSSPGPWKQGSKGPRPHPPGWPACEARRAHQRRTRPRQRAWRPPGRTEDRVGQAEHRQPGEHREGCCAKAQGHCRAPRAREGAPEAMTGLPRAGIAAGDTRAWKAPPVRGHEHRARERLPQAYRHTARPMLRFPACHRAHPGTMHPGPTPACARAPAPGAGRVWVRRRPGLHPPASCVCCQASKDGSPACAASTASPRLRAWCTHAKKPPESGSFSSAAPGGGQGVRGLGTPSGRR